MCNIQILKCCVCKTPIEIHLGGYDTSPDEIEVFCKDHIPKENVVIWQSTSKGRRRGVQDLCIKNTYLRVGIRALTENARMNGKVNYPNTETCEIFKERL